MAKSLDKVLQPDGTYKWELVEPSYAEKMGNGSEASVAYPAPKKNVVTVNLKTMTKAELETYGRSLGIELDKRHTKADLIAELEKFTSTN
tara:strand:- start:885 stop:1154 length:270 start_codon:yes stop_codon:yes gene_type:complete